MEQAFRRLERGISIFWVRSKLVGDILERTLVGYVLECVLVEGTLDGACFGRDLCDTATDVSSVGRTRRGREGDNGDVGLRVEAVRVRDRDLVLVFEGLREPWLGGGDPSDNRASAVMQPSRSKSDAVFGSRSDLLVNRGICVTKEIGPSRTGGGYARGNACGGQATLNGQGFLGESMGEAGSMNLDGCCLRGWAGSPVQKSVHGYPRDWCLRER